MERVFRQPSPPHGHPSVARPDHPQPVFRGAHITVEDRLDVIQSKQEHHVEFMRYQYDWQFQMRS